MGIGRRHYFCLLTESSHAEVSQYEDHNPKQHLDRHPFPSISNQAVTTMTLTLHFYSVSLERLEMTRLLATEKFTRLKYCHTYTHKNNAITICSQLTSLRVKVIGILINLTEKESCLLASLDLYSKQSVSDDKFYRRIYSEPLTSCKGIMGGLPERPLKQGGPGVEGWVFVLRIKNYETLLYTTDFLKNKHIFKDVEFFSPFTGNS